MIETNNAVYLHVPKTGGTWMRAILQPIAINEYHHEILTQPHSKPVCAFVRNPWAWYVSSFNAITKGTTSDPFDARDPVIVAFGCVPTFDQFLRCQLFPTSDFKRKLLTIFKLRDDGAFVKIAERWQTSNKDWYSLLLDLFLEHATEVGQVEHIKLDLTLMMDKVGDLNDATQSLLKTTPKLNVGEDVYYRDYYNNEQRMYVQIACRAVCDRFDYQY